MKIRSFVVILRFHTTQQTQFCSNSPVYKVFDNFLEPGE